MAWVAMKKPSRSRAGVGNSSTPSPLPDGWREVMTFLKGEWERDRKNLEEIRSEITALREALTGHGLRLGEVDAMQRQLAALDDRLATYDHSLHRLVEVHLPELRRDIQTQVETIARAADHASSEASHAGKAVFEHEEAHRTQAQQARKEDAGIRIELIKARASVIAMIVGGIFTVVNLLITLSNQKPP